MSCYQWVWRGLWGTVAVVAIAGACVSWSLGTVLGLFFIPAVVAALVTYLYYRDPNRPLASLSHALHRSFSIGMTTGACTLAFASLLSALLTLAWPLLALCVCTSPAALRRVREEVRSRAESRRRRERAPAEEATWWRMLAHEVEGLADRELCQVWRASYSALLAAENPTTAAQVVRIRQVYLDELDRRHRRAISAWLASGPRPTAGPERFLPVQRERDPL